MFAAIENVRPHFERIPRAACYMFIIDKAIEAVKKNEFKQFAASGFEMRFTRGAQFNLAAEYAIDDDDIIINDCLDLHYISMTPKGARELLDYMAERFN